MSRTDHHRPWQIQAADRTNKHNRAYYWHNNWAHSIEGGCNDTCGWTFPHSVLSGPPHDYVHGLWYGPERARERDRLGQLAAEWNAHGDLEDGDFNNPQHRHRAQWAWW